MEFNNNGLIVSVYRVGNEWKVAHCLRIRSRFGKSVVKTFPTETEAIKYARQV